MFDVRRLELVGPACGSDDGRTAGDRGIAGLPCVGVARRATGPLAVRLAQRLPTMVLPEIVGDEVATGGFCPRIVAETAWAL